MARGKLRAFVQRLKDRIAFNRRTFILYSVLRALVLLTLIRCIMTQRWEGVAISVLVLVLFLVPSILEDKARIEIPGLFQAIIYTFIFAAEILGEMGLRRKSWTKTVRRPACSATSRGARR